MGEQNEYLIGREGAVHSRLFLQEETSPASQQTAPLAALPRTWALTALFNIKIMAPSLKYMSHLLSGTSVPEEKGCPCVFVGPPGPRAGFCIVQPKTCCQQEEVGGGEKWHPVFIYL